MNNSHIYCPFCGNNFAPKDVRFKIKLGELLPNADVLERNMFVYISNNPQDVESNKFLKNNNIQITYDNTEMPEKIITVHILGQPIRENLSLGVRVCNNPNCHQELSINAGKYPAENGIFFLGLRQSGKTVMITSLINKIEMYSANQFNSKLKPYNNYVNTQYIDEYFTPMFEKKILPKSTTMHNQLAYEWINNDNSSTVGIYFSDIRGEDANNADTLLHSKEGASLKQAFAYVLIVDVKTMNASQVAQRNTLAIFDNILDKVVSADQRSNKYLAIVVTKTDKLIDEESGNVFSADSEIYRTLDLIDNENFSKERNNINLKLKKYFETNYNTLVTRAESIFSSQNIGYFAVSAIGFPPDSDNNLSSEPKPTRVEEPIIWLLDQKKVIKWQQPIIQKVKVKEKKNWFMSLLQKQ